VPAAFTVTVIGESVSNSISSNSNITNNNSTQFNSSIDTTTSVKLPSVFETHNISTSTITGYISKISNYGLVTIKFSSSPEVS
jgi:hypothetical protein